MSSSIAALVPCHMEVSMCLAIIPAALVRSPCTREVGHRPPCDDPDRVREGYEKSTIAGDDPKAFRDKYRFTLHGETGTDPAKSGQRCSGRRTSRKDPSLQVRNR